jgi:hypothetical protein
LKQTGKPKPEEKEMKRASQEEADKRFEKVKALVALGKPVKSALSETGLQASSYYSRLKKEKANHKVPKAKTLRIEASHTPTNDRLIVVIGNTAQVLEAVKGMIQ